MPTRARILAIEDSRPFVDLLRAIFRYARIDRAEALALAYDKLAGHEYDFVILDLDLPDSRPEQTIAAIADLRAKCGQARVIVTTGYEGYETAVRRQNVECLSKADVHFARQLTETIERGGEMKAFRPKSFVFVA